MARETLVVDANEDLDAIINRLRQSRSKDVMVVLPNKTRALETLDQFNALRRTVRDEGINLTFAGGNKTVQGLAKLLGFQIEKGDGAASPAADANSDDNLPSGFAEFESTPTSQPTRSFGGPPPGFVVQDNNQSTTRIEPPPRPTRNPQDIFNFQPPEMPTRTPPPSPPPNFLSEDVPLTRENAGSFFGGGAAIPNPPPPPAFDFEAPTGSRTMSYEEAARQGFLTDEAPTRQGGGGLPFDLADDRDEDVPSILDVGGDNAAADFQQRSGVRRRGDTSGGRGRGRQARTADEDLDVAEGTRPTRQRGAGLAGVAAGLGGSVSRIFNPGRRTAAPRAEGIRMERPALPPDVQRQRERQKRQYRLWAMIGTLVVFLLFVAVIFFFLKGNQNPATTSGAAQTQKVNLILSTAQVTNTVSILLDTKAGASATATPPSTAVSGSASSSNPTDQTQAGSPGRLGVTDITTGNITKEGEWPAFGSTTRPEGFAQGPVTFYNAGVSAKSYGAGAVIFTRNGVQYKLVNPLTVPGGDPVGGRVGQANGTLQAGVPGPSGNIAAPGRVNITDSLVVIIGKMEGGTEKTVKVVSKEDKAALQNKLVADAQAEAQRQLQGKYDPQSQGIQFLPTAAPQCTFSKNPGEEADKFSGSCVVSGRAIIYNKQALVDAVKGTLLKNPNEVIEPSSLKFTGDGQVKEENGRLIYTVPVTATVYQPLNDQAKRDIAALIAGKSTDEARTAIMDKYNQQLLDVSFGDFKGVLPEASKLDVQTVFDTDVVSEQSPVASPGATGTPNAPVTGTPPTGGASPQPAGSPNPTGQV